MSIFSTAEKSARSYRPTPDQLRASNPAHSVWVSANAGSGKTHVLVERVIRLLLAGADPAAILCITFTKAAAAEMSGRLFERLGTWTGLDDAALRAALRQLGVESDTPEVMVRARRLFTLALETPGGLKIQTIHAFCERLLHLFPVEAGMAPGFHVMDERTAQELRQRATVSILQAAKDAPDGARATGFRLLTERLNPEQFEVLIKTFSASLADLGSAARLSTDEYAALLKMHLGLARDADQVSLTRAINAIDRAAYTLHAHALQNYPTHNKRNIASLLLAIAQAETPEHLLLEFFLTKKFEPRDSLISADAAKANRTIVDFFGIESQRITALLHQRNTLTAIAASTAAFGLARAILDEFESEKRRLGLYDFSDLISRAAQLLSSQRATQWVLYKMDQNLSHVLVDEAQDTSPDQWRIVLALAAEFFAGEGVAQPKARTLFVVGDMKQSIYSFQGADAVSYLAVRQALTAPRGEGPGLKEVDLTISYRSAQGILDAVDAVFPPVQMHKIGVPHSTEGHTAARTGAEAIVELWPLQEELEDLETEDAWSAPVDRPPQSSPRRQLARHIAETIAQWLLPHAPRKLAGENRAVRADDILILFQTRGTLYHMVLAALRQAKVPVAGADRLNLLQSLIVQDLLMLLNWLLLPQDDHALAVVLKSPLVPEPVHEDALFTLCHDRGSATLISRLKGGNADYLHGLLALSKISTPFELLTQILNQARPAIAARLGPEAIEASAAVLDMALEHEHTHATSLFGFVRWFSTTETTLKRELEQGQGTVRLMTVHGAKGLEAKIVFMPDTTAIPTGASRGPRVILIPAAVQGAGLPFWLPSGVGPVAEAVELWQAEEKVRAAAERNRLLYVAMTRAADELYMTGTKPKRGDPPAESWWTTIAAALGQPEGDKPWRRGPPDQPAVATDIRPSSETIIKPNWLVPAPIERKARLAAHPSYGGEASRRGRAVHRLLEDLGAVPAGERRELAQKRAVRLHIPVLDALDLADALNHPDLEPYFGETSQAEVDIVGMLENVQVNGRVDRLAITSEGIWVLDYKTDRSVGESLVPTHPYASQMATYAGLLAQAYPGKPVTAALFWTTPKRLEILSETLLTAALRDPGDQVS